MPIYEAKCNECGEHQDVFRPVSQCGDMPECCGVQMQKVFKPLHVIGDMQPYKSPIDGQWVTSRSQHRQHMKAHGVIEVGNEKLSGKPRKEQKDPKLRKEIEKNLYQAGVIT
jgi:hypothetical protein